MHNYFYHNILFYNNIAHNYFYHNAQLVLHNAQFTKSFCTSTSHNALAIS